MMRKIQLSVMLIALCLLFATYASALTPRYPPHWNPRKLLRGESELLEHESQFPSTKWKKIGPWIGPRHLVSLSDAEAEKINWKKVGKKIAGIGQAAANLGAIRNLFLSEAEADAEFRSWPPTGPWGTPPYIPRGLSDAEGPWSTVYNPNPRPYLLSEAEIEKINLRISMLDWIARERKPHKL